MYKRQLSEHVEFVDAFGHKQLAGSAKFLANKIGAELGIKTRAIELSTLQRCAAHMTSRTDITEADVYKRQPDKSTVCKPQEPACWRL